MRQKPKTNRKADAAKSNLIDRCQTPPHALTPLLPYLDKSKVIWEPAMGEGLMVKALKESGFTVVGSDILSGANFFTYTASRFDCIVTNPPYSIKYAWLKRCYELRCPFALLLPIETLGSSKAQSLFERYVVGVILLNQRINFKMPLMGFDGGGAKFPVGWFTYGFNVETIAYGKLDKAPKAQMKLI